MHHRRVQRVISPAMRDGVAVSAGRTRRHHVLSATTIGEFVALNVIQALGPRE
jgi:hypothetical protein